MSERFSYLDKYADLSPWLRVIRLPLALLGILMSMALLSQIDELFTLYGALVVFVVGTGNIGMNILNEVRDIEDDRENKPWRPLPQGEITPKQAYAVSLTLITASSLAIGPLALYVSVVPALLLTASLLFALVYNLGERGKLGVSSMSMSYALAGAGSLFYHPKLMLGFIVGFWSFTFAFNILQQLQDIDDDLKETVPKQLGPHKTLRFAQILSLASVLWFGNLWSTHDSPIGWLVFVPTTILLSLPTIALKYARDKSTDTMAFYHTSYKDQIEEDIRGLTRGILIVIVIALLIHGVWL